MRGETFGRFNRKKCLFPLIRWVSYIFLELTNFLHKVKTIVFLFSRNHSVATLMKTDFPQTLGHHVERTPFFMTNILHQLGLHGYVVISHYMVWHLNWRTREVNYTMQMAKDPFTTSTKCPAWRKYTTIQRLKLITATNVPIQSTLTHTKPRGARNKIK